VQLIDSLWVGATEQRKKPQLMFCVSTKVLATRTYYCPYFFFWLWGFYKSEPESNLELYWKVTAPMAQNLVYVAQGTH